MHKSALAVGKKFFEIYGRPDWKVAIDFGAMDINGSLRSICPSGIFFLGLDVEYGKSVDLKVSFGEPIPLREDFADCVLSSSQMEHDDFFWSTFLDYCRIVKPGGNIYINAPSNGVYHRHPNDNWRFFPDCGLVLTRWAKKNGFDIELCESFIAEQKDDVWNDFVAVFVKGAPNGDRYMADEIQARNVWKFGASTLERFSKNTEDLDLLHSARQRIAELERALEVAGSNLKVAER